MPSIATPKPYMSPLSTAQRNQWFGTPQSVKSINVVGEIPYNPRLRDGRTQSVRVHPLLVDKFVDTCVEAHRRSRYNPSRMDSHVVREIRGVSGVYSVHSWACAWDIFESVYADQWPPGGVWTPDADFVNPSDTSTRNTNVTQELADFVEVWLEAGFWWGGFFRRKSGRPSGQTKGPGGMDTPHFEWRQAPPSSSTKGTSMSTTIRTLRRGDQGEDVAIVQTALNELGWSLVVDGFLGPITEGAIKAFQQAAGLTQDGIVGPQTRAAIAAERDRRKQAATPAPVTPTPAPAPTPPPASNPPSDPQSGSQEELKAGLTQADVRAALSDLRGVRMSLQRQVKAVANIEAALTGKDPE